MSNSISNILGLGNTLTEGLPSLNIREWASTLDTAILNLPLGYRIGGVVLFTASLVFGIPRLILAVDTYLFPGAFLTHRDRILVASFLRFNESQRQLYTTTLARLFAQSVRPGEDVTSDRQEQIEQSLGPVVARDCTINEHEESGLDPLTEGELQQQADQIRTASGCSDDDQTLWNRLNTCRQQISSTGTGLPSDLQQRFAEQFPRRTFSVANHYAVREVPWEELVRRRDTSCPTLAKIVRAVFPI